MDWKTNFQLVRQWTTATYSSSIADRIDVPRRLSAIGAIEGGFPAASVMALVQFVSDVSNHVFWERLDIRDPTSHSAGQLRKLGRKVKALQQALEKVNAYVADIEKSNPWLVQDLANMFPLFQQLEVIDEPIRELYCPQIDGEPPASSSQQQREPNFHRGALQTTLHAFFVNEWRLSSNEAQIRTAAIGNEFWYWNLQVTEKFDLDRRRGSDAVRKAVKRSARRRPAS